MLKIVDNLLRYIDSKTPHWIFLQGRASLMQCKNPRIPHRNYDTLKIEFATHSDIPELIKFTRITGAQGNLSQEEICKQRLERGDRLHLIKDGTNIINVIWISRGKFYIRGYGFKYDTGDDSLYLYNGYTAPEMRMRGIFNMALANIAEYAKSEGRTRFIALIEQDNKPSIAYHKRLNFQTLSEVRFYKIFGIKFCFIIKENSLSQWNIHIKFPEGYTVI